MNTMLRSSNAPQQTALAPSSMSPGGRPTGSGVPRGVWIGGGLMALTIVALATALVMKSGGSETTAQVPPAPATTLATPAPTATPATPATTTPAPVAQDTTPAPVHHTVRHTAPRSNTDTSPTFNDSPNTSMGSSNSGNSNVGMGNGSSGNTTVASVPVCTTCGVIDSYSAVQVQGQTNGVGAVAGGVGGAVLGSQIAGRHNRTLGGVIGAIGGGLLGNTIEQHERTTTMYDVHVRMNDGSMRTIRQATVPQVGERVSVDGNTIHAAPAQTSSNYGGGTNYTPSTNGGSTFSPSGS
jgi:outer membrane lipoprotein SlyB